MPDIYQKFTATEISLEGIKSKLELYITKAEVELQLQSLREDTDY